MRADDPVMVRKVPETLWNFIHEGCGIPASAFHSLPGAELPEPCRRLLVHLQDMTSTLAAFHESLLRVEVLERRVLGELYLREVFLRSLATDAIVEYGVIAIALEQFAPPAQEAILAGEVPLGALLHRYKIPFVCAPIGFFSVSGKALTGTPLAPPLAATCYGRFNLLAKPTGEPLAWILEILPPA